MSITAITAQPDWCDDHDGFEDGSADWRKSRALKLAGTIGSSVRTFRKPIRCRPLAWPPPR